MAPSSRVSCSVRLDSALLRLVDRAVLDPSLFPYRSRTAVFEAGVRLVLAKAGRVEAPGDTRLLSSRPPVVTLVPMIAAPVAAQVGTSMAQGVTAEDLLGIVILPANEPGLDLVTIARDHPAPARVWSLYFERLGGEAHVIGRDYRLGGSPNLFPVEEGLLLDTEAISLVPPVGDGCGWRGQGGDGLTLRMHPILLVPNEAQVHVRAVGPSGSWARFRVSVVCEPLHGTEGPPWPRVEGLPGMPGETPEMGGP